MNRHLVIMAAGTGGHIMPGLAVAQEMQRRGWTVSWLGTTHGMENTLVPPSNIPMDRIRFSGMRGKGLWHTLVGSVRFLGALINCVHILRRRAADAVLGMGGYVCLPGGLMAGLLGKPLMLMNADAALLLSNKFLLSVADRVGFGFASQAVSAIKHAVVTGNPVRLEIASIAAPAFRFNARSGPLRMLIVGGSLGAKALNDVVPAALANMPEANRPIVVHQTGRANYQAVQAAYQNAHVIADVRPFIDDMATELAQCDLIICRAGAITVSELCAAGVASVLVPLVVSTTSHQRDNAQWMAAQGAAIHIPQKEFSSERLVSLLQTTDRSALQQLAQQARSLALPEATVAVANEIEAIARKKMQ